MVSYTLTLEQVIGTEVTGFPFDDHQCKSIMQVYNILKGLLTCYRQWMKAHRLVCVIVRSNANNGVHFVPVLLWHIASIMEDVWHCRYRSHYGIINRPADDVPSEPSQISRYFDFMMSCLLFGRHNSFHRRLQTTRPNGKVYIPEFRAFVEGVVSEWNGNIIHNLSSDC